VFFIALAVVPHIAAYVEALAGALDGDVGASKVEPQVAVGVCDERNTLHPQFMDSAGRWVSDLQMKNSCLKDKVDILEFCRKSYRGRNITNIVEASRAVKIDNWCKIGHNRKCKTVQSVKPYRCLVGAFQSEALLVPEQCVFDHVHNASRCWSYDEWNATAANACSARDLKLKSFAILLPCGVDVFSGVEFVCCPSAPAAAGAAEKLSTKDDDLNDNQDDDDDDDDEDDDDDDDAADVDADADAAAASASSSSVASTAVDDVKVENKKKSGKKSDDLDDDEDDYDEDEENEVESDEVDDFAATSTTAAKTTTTTTTTSTTTTTTPKPTPDPYLTHYNAKEERDDYLDAEQRLEERHRERVSKIMKDWSDLEDRYQDLHATNSKDAEEFKRKMTNRFQKLVKAMEDEDVAEKRQLSAVHQQRVLAAINEKKREAMSCYTDALNENLPSSRRIQKCLEKLLRALHKDRHHSLSHFRHLLNTNPGQAQREKEATVQHLNDIDRLTNQSLAMLDRYPEMQAKIIPLMKDHLMALRSKDDTPSPLLASLSPTSEDDVLDSFKAQVASKQAEKERQRLAEKARKEDERRRDDRKKAEKQEGKNKKTNMLADANEDASKSDAPRETSASDKTLAEPTTTSTTVKSTTASDKSKLEKFKLKEDFAAKKEKSKDKKVKTEDLAQPLQYVDAQAVQHSQERPKVAHAQNHQIGHSEPAFSVRHEGGSQHENRSVYFTLAFAGIALLAAMIVGIVFVKRRHARSPQQQGFIEVDQAITPEERHVANMQINGYENPTYKYFEAKE